MYNVRALRRKNKVIYDRLKENRIEYESPKATEMVEKEKKSLSIDESTYVRLCELMQEDEIYKNPLLTGTNWLPDWALTDIICLKSSRRILHSRMLLISLIAIVLNMLRHYCLTSWKCQLLKSERRPVSIPAARSTVFSL